MASTDNAEQSLATINERLSALLRRPAAEMSTGGVQAMSDRLWVWGVLGGKEVGKSSLINALAGSSVVESGNDADEGTSHPAAYLAPEDLANLNARFSELGDMPIDYFDRASNAMRGLVLVDLPDFDSLFGEHVDRVRKIAGVLDGIIWITTPKKVGDLRAIAEIRRVLKDRTNFVYVVNKIDWLLAQSPGSPDEELDRMATALARQITHSGGDEREGRCFLVSARYRTADGMLDAVARSRNAGTAGGNGALAAAVDRVVDEFAALRRELTTAPAADALAARKRANLRFQLRTQAEQLLNHYRPREVLTRLERITAPGTIERMVSTSIPPTCIRQLLAQLNSPDALFVEWSSAIFRKRVAQWTLLGIIAWPLTMIGAVLRAVVAWMPRTAARRDADPFRVDGIGLDERAAAIAESMHLELAALERHLKLSAPNAGELEHALRNDALMLAEQHRETVVSPMLEHQPTPVGRVARQVLPILVLAWFPLVQPLLAAATTSSGGLATPSAIALVQAFSAANVLFGLGAAVLILGGIVGAIYSVAVRDTYAAIDRLRDGPIDLVGDALLAPMVRVLRRPLDDVQERLTRLTESLEQIAALGEIA